VLVLSDGISLNQTKTHSLFFPNWVADLLIYCCYFFLSL
jgi:hypothetical protein